MSEKDPPLRANPGYVLGQLARALSTAGGGETDDLRSRATEKVRKWTDVFRGLLSGALGIGSRTPVPATPPWVTLEVLTGGFATGEFAAGGPLREHERSLLARLPWSGAADRTRINSHYVSDNGCAELQGMLDSRRYQVGVPEEGALLVVAWLVREGHVVEARALLDEIGPYFDRLRFYPRPAIGVPPRGGTVHFQTVGWTRREIEDLRPSKEVLAMREAIRIWHPLYDRAVALFGETVTGTMPALATSSDGRPLRDENGRFSIEGGWPCQQYPDGWNARARALLQDYAARRAKHRLDQKPERRRENFARLRGYLERCLSDPKSLSGADVGMVRLILASVNRRRGLPGTARLQALRESQEVDAARPMTAELARVLGARLRSLAQDQALSAFDDLCAPLSEEEALAFGLTAGEPMPESLCARLYRSLETTLETLVERKVITSCEALAIVLPQLVSHVRGHGLPGPEVALLYAAIYEAFRRRRSLLLLNLESQVRLEELPWVRAIEVYREGTTEEGAGALLQRVVRLCLESFPYTILPNKLLQEIRSLSRAAGLVVPIVEELASDIFMGEFTGKFVAAAWKAASLLQGTLYERYYRIPYAEVLTIGDLSRTRGGAQSSRQFAELCEHLAGASSRDQGSVARNGTIIEQAQIVTTHNLATLFDALALVEPPGMDLGKLAGACFEWVCRNFAHMGDGPAQRLRLVKNNAYAWRQMIFYLSLAPPAAVEQFFDAAATHLEKRPDPRVALLLDSLIACSRSADADVRPFLGWTVGPHPLFS
jgi:hypothetical protein